MKDLTSTLYIAIGIIFGILALVLFFLTPEVLINAVIFLIWSLIMIVTGIFRTGSGHVPNKKREREAAMILALAGLGHRYFGQEKRSLFFTISIILSFIITLFGFIEILGDNPYLGMVIFFYGLTTMVLFIGWSCLEVNELCDREGLAHEYGPFDMNWNKTELGIRILLVTTFLVIVTLSVAYVHYDIIDIMVAVAVIIISFALPAYLIYTAKTEFGSANIRDGGISKETDDQRRFIKNFFFKRNMKKGIYDPIAMKLGTLAESMLFLQVAIISIVGIYFILCEKLKEAYIFALSLMFLMALLYLICIAKAHKIQRLSSSGNTEEIERIYRRGRTYVCVFTIVYLTVSCVLMYYLLSNPLS